MKILVLNEFILSLDNKNTDAANQYNAEYWLR